MTINNPTARVCLIPNVTGIGGMVSFRGRLAQGLEKRGKKVVYNLADTPYDAILVIGGTRNLAGIWRAKQQGVRVVQRLDGMNWIHRKKRTGWRHFIRAEYGNLILSLIRSRLADQIIYQSGFSHQWWDRVYGKSSIPWAVVHNGVDLERYTPNGEGEPPDDHDRILLVEGALGGGYETGLEIAIHMVERLCETSPRNIELVVVGRVSADLQKEWTGKTEIQVKFTGQVPSEIIPEIDRSAHVLFAADLNPACPNSVIEALACGLPVAAYDTGALPEIVTEGAGQLVPYGGDPWKLDPPDIDGLAKAIISVLGDQTSYRAAARRRAENAFGLDKMVEGYLSAMKL
jgi:glycosyltransferase involved in cell wall biosynthesis